MFSKKQRLCKQRDIEAVFKKGVSTYNSLFGLKVIENNLKYSRYTVIIGKKVSKLAIERNRIKRIVKQTLKEYDSQIKKNIDCVVITLKLAKNAERKKIQQTIKTLLQKTKLI